MTAPLRFALLLCFLSGPCLFAEESLPAFSSSDRILVMAPHPDDEMIGAGGTVQQALKAGAQVKVMLLTHGENNMVSYLVYKKRFFFTRKSSLEMGAMRREEAVQALRPLGLTEKEIVSLGYPDFGTLKILTRHWGSAKPYHGVLSRSTQVPFADALSPEASYRGENILKDFTRILEDYQPTKIFVSHPADENRDHRALYLFTRVALWDLEGKIQRPELYPYLIHLKGWPSPQGFHPDLKLQSPEELLECDVQWKSLALSPDEIEAKYQAIHAYPSQIKYAPDNLISYVRSNELFGDYPEIPLLPPAAPQLIWEEMKNYNPLLLTKETAQQKFIAKIAYANDGERLHVRIELKHLRNRIMGVSLALLGYKKGTAFAEMPKIEVFMRLNRFGVKDKNKKISKKQVNVRGDGKVWTVSLPLELLGSPDFVLSAAKTRRAWDLSIDETAWRVLRLKA